MVYKNFNRNISIGQKNFRRCKMVFRTQDDLTGNESSVPVFLHVRFKESL